MRPSEAASQHAAGVLRKWLTPDEPQAELEARHDFEALLAGLRAADVDAMNDGPLARFYTLAAAATYHGRHEAEVLDALWAAADGLGDLLDAAVLVNERLARLAELLSRETRDGAHG
ncbi:MAG: hypothetical protein Q7J84_13905 [Sulfuricaulis sp.]|nr:hypothetical protein [Sulfuricaulis sp.]